MFENKCYFIKTIPKTLNKILTIWVNPQNLGKDLLNLNKFYMNIIATRLRILKTEVRTHKNKNHKLLVKRISIIQENNGIEANKMTI